MYNIYLDRFDKLMERRDHRFVRYADDIAIFVRIPRAAKRMMGSNIRFFKGEYMKLKINREKSRFGSTVGMKLLGFKLPSEIRYTYRASKGRSALQEACHPADQEEQEMQP